jgi:hypothetical protein
MQAQAQQGADAWLGAFLTPVQVDEWGVFKFLLLRVSCGTQQRQKLLLRGSNGSSEGAVMEAARQEMVQVARTRGLAMEQLEVGAGPARLPLLLGRGGGGALQRRGCCSPPAASLRTLGRCTWRLRACGGLPACLRGRLQPPSPAAL